MDTVSKRVRSRIMSKIKSSNTGPEKLAEKLLVPLGFYKQKSVSIFEGAVMKASMKVDFVMHGHGEQAFSVAVFVDGCFFHGCPKHYKEPTSNVKYWRDKIRNNRKRDAREDAALIGAGWIVVHIWEHTLKNTNAKRFIVPVIQGLIKAGSKEVIRI